MMETVRHKHQRRPSGNSAFFGGGSSDSGGSSTSTSPSPPDHFGGHGVFAAQQFSPTAVDSAYVSTTSSPSGAGRFSIWSTNAAADAISAEEKANNARRQLFADYDTRHQVPQSPVRQKSCPEAVSLSSSRFKHSSVAYADKPMRNVFIEPNSGMRDIPMWLKGLRLHKYTTMFQQMDYEQMLGLDEVQLEQQGVTKGARRKILQSVQKLRERVDFLRQLEKDVNEQGGIRTTLIELRAMIHTPIRPYPLPGRPEPIQARIDGLTIPTEEIDPENLPAHLVRVLGKVHMAIFESPETNLEDEYFSVLLQIYERIIHHEAFTLAQKQRVMAWKRTVKKVFSPTLTRRRTSSYQFPPGGVERRGAAGPTTAAVTTGCFQTAPFAPPTMRGSGACSPDRQRRIGTANGRWMQMLQSTSQSTAPGHFPPAPVTVEQFALLRDMVAMQQFQLLSMAAHRYSAQALFDQQQQNGQQTQQPQPHRAPQAQQPNQQPSMNGRCWPAELSRHNSAPPNVSHPPPQTQSQSQQKFASTTTSPTTTASSNGNVCQSQQLNQLAATLAAANFPHQPPQQRRSAFVAPSQQQQLQLLQTKQQLQPSSQWPPGLGLENSPLWSSSTTTSSASDSLASSAPRPIKAHTFPTGSVSAASNHGGSLSSGSDRSSGAESPLGLMVYNFCGSQFELDKMCRSVAEMTLDLGAAAVQSKEISSGY